MFINKNIPKKSEDFSECLENARDIAERISRYLTNISKILSRWLTNIAGVVW